MTSLLIDRSMPAEQAGRWRAGFARSLPDEPLIVWPEEVADHEVEYVLVWNHAHGELERFKNLKAILSLGAGVEHILDDPAIDRALPVIRLIDPNLKSTMAEYLLARCLHYQRDLHIYETNQRADLWQPRPYRPRANVTIGILGLGELGRAVAVELSAAGYQVLGWSRSKKSIEGMTCFAGADGLDAMLRKTEIAVCLLPLTAETNGILSNRAFDLLPRGACVINAGRGGHLVDEDLLAALENGQLAHATLDVFRQEPLPDDHPFWAHPKVAVTPHISGPTLADDAPRIVADSIACLKRGETPHGLVERKRGY
jgi:glyoxylate/hydroxypyruvate reductase A